MEKEQMAKTTKRVTSGKCIGAIVVQHIHKWSTYPPRHSQLHLCWSQGKGFNNIEATLTSALGTMTTYYKLNQLCENPSKTQVCAFHLRNRDAKREINVTWNGTRLDNTSIPVYLGVHLDRTLSYKTHICSTKQKVNARNNIIRKLANSKLG